MKNALYPFKLSLNPSGKYLLYIPCLLYTSGETVYAKSVAGESYEEEVAGMIGQIRGKYEEIEQQKAAIEQLAVQEKQILGNQSMTVNIRYCANCGAQNAANYKFCSKCGRCV